jgi:lauroyl/myristoyl acyltransferase
VLLTPHLGSFEVCAQAYAERFGAQQPITVLYRPARQPWLRELEETARARPALATAPATLAGVRQMMRALRKGETVGLLPDQVPPDGMGVWAPFFGQPAYTMTLAARLVQQTGAAVAADLDRTPAAGCGYVVHVQALAEALPTRGEQDEEAWIGAAGVVNRAMEDRDPPARAVPVGLPPLQAAAPAGAAHDGNLAARALLALVWLLHWLPLGLQAALGRGLGRLLHALARVAAGAVALAQRGTVPARAGPPAERQALVREHFQWLGRSLLERACCGTPAPSGCAADPRRRRRRLAERSDRAVMWLVPHFLALDVAGAATQLFQKHRGFDHLPGRRATRCWTRHARGRCASARRGLSRARRRLPLVRAIRRGHAFFNLPDMDFGLRDAAFVPFFGVRRPRCWRRRAWRAAEHGGAAGGGRDPARRPGLPVRFMPWTDWPSDDPVADAARMNRWIETRSAAARRSTCGCTSASRRGPPGEAIAVRPQGPG